MCLCDGNDDCGDQSDETRDCVVEVSCSFESSNVCGYTLLGWRKDSGSVSRNDLLRNSGPSFDHTSGLASAYNSYIVTAEDGADLVSPSFTADGKQCLEFYYFISSSANKLEVLAGETVVGQTSGSGQIWKRSQFTLPSGSYAITFKADVSDPSYIAIDDVVVYAGACVDGCPSGKFQCQDGTCVSGTFRCDGVANCLDSSDEMSCGSTAPISCSFDLPFACGFRQDDSDDFNWEFQYGEPEIEVSTGPASGHSEDPENPDLSYLLARPPFDFDRSVIRWPLVITGPACFNFFYYMYGQNVGTLTIHSGSNILWQKSGDQGRDWFNASVEIESGNDIEISTQSSSKVRAVLHLRFKPFHLITFYSNSNTLIVVCVVYLPVYLH